MWGVSNNNFCKKIHNVCLPAQKYTFFIDFLVKEQINAGITFKLLLFFLHKSP